MSQMMLITVEDVFDLGNRLVLAPGVDSSVGPMYSNGTILVGKGFFDTNCPTFNDWAIIFKIPVTTI